MYRNPQQMKQAQGFNDLSDKQKAYFIEMMYDINQDILLPLQDYSSAIVKAIDNSLEVKLIMNSGRIKKYVSNKMGVEKVRESNGLQMY